MCFHVRNQQLNQSNNPAVNSRLLVRRQKKQNVLDDEHVEQTVDDVW